jgi:peptidoglycan hydrolase CwlO-like protein
MSGAQEQRREKNIEEAKVALDNQLAPYRAQQDQLRAQIAQSQPPSAELQLKLDAVTAEIGQIINGSFWWQLYQKD